MFTITIRLPGSIQVLRPLLLHAQGVSIILYVLFKQTEGR